MGGAGSTVTPRDSKEPSRSSSVRKVKVEEKKNDDEPLKSQSCENSPRGGPRKDGRGVEGAIVGDNYEIRKRIYRMQVRAAEQEDAEDEPQFEPQIQEFARSIFDTVAQSEVLDHILSDELGIKAFRTFLHKEYAQDNLQFYLACDQAKESARKFHMQPTHNMYAQYLHPDAPLSVALSTSVKTRLSELASVDELNVEQTEVLTTYLTKAQKEIKSLIAVAAIPKFLTSQQFMLWRRQAETLQQREVIKTVSTPIASYFNEESKMKGEFRRFLDDNDWLMQLVGCFEDMPVCISIASACKSFPGFPLCYVNKCFESNTGYNRNEIIGQNCRFLQVCNTNPELRYKCYNNIA